MSAISTEVHNGYHVTLHHDEFSESPRDWDNTWTLYTWERNYRSPDKNPYGDHEEFESSVTKDLLVAPIYKYEHGSVVYSSDNSVYPFNCRWDSGQVGYAVISVDKILKSFPYDGDDPAYEDAKKETAQGGFFDVMLLPKDLIDSVLTSLNGELNTYTQWCNGDVYSATVETPDGECVESLGGLYGLDYAMGCAIEELVPDEPYVAPTSIQETDLAEVRKLLTDIQNLAVEKPTLIPVLASAALELLDDYE